MSFNSEVTKASGDHLGNPPPTGIGMNLKPSVGLFRNGGEPAIYMKGNVQCPAHNASYSMAPQFNNGMLKDEQSTQRCNELRPTICKCISGSNMSSGQTSSVPPKMSK